MTKRPKVVARVILKLESFEGRDTYLRCGNDVQDCLYCIVLVTAKGASVVDSGYRSYEEAAEAWPDAY